jgi:hypothetical protein
MDAVLYRRSMIVLVSLFCCYVACVAHESVSVTCLTTLPGSRIYKFGWWDEWWSWRYLEGIGCSLIKLIFRNLRKPSVRISRHFGRDSNRVPLDHSLKHFRYTSLLGRIYEEVQLRTGAEKGGSVRFDWTLVIMDPDITDKILLRRKGKRIPMFN